MIMAAIARKLPHCNVTRWYNGVTVGVVPLTNFHWEIYTTNAKTTLTISSDKHHLSLDLSNAPCQPSLPTSQLEYASCVVPASKGSGR